MRRRLLADVHARLGRLERDDLALGVLRLEELAAARDAAAGADAVDEVVDLALRLLPDLGARVREVRRGVVHVAHLVRHPVVVVGRDQVLGVLQPGGNSVRWVEEVDVGAELG